MSWKKAPSISVNSGSVAMAETWSCHRSRQRRTSSVSSGASDVAPLSDAPGVFLPLVGP